MVEGGPVTLDAGDRLERHCKSVGPVVHRVVVLFKRELQEFVLWFLSNPPDLWC